MGEEVDFRMGWMEYGTGKGGWEDVKEGYYPESAGQ